MEAKTYDAFISHASEDKKNVALPIAEKLQEHGMRVWLDTKEIRLGDRFPVKISEGLRLSQYGVVILSKAYFSKRWPVDELEALLGKETDNTVVLPVLHGLSHDDLRKIHPILATKHSVSTDDGLDKVADAIAETIGLPFTKAPETEALAKFIMIRVPLRDQQDGRDLWNEMQSGCFQRNFEMASDPLFDLMIRNNGPETLLLLKAGIRVVKRTPGVGGTMGYSEPVKVQARLKVTCPDNWKRFDLTMDRVWVDLPDPIEMKKDDSPFRFTLLLENFCDIESASSSEVRFCLKTDKGIVESESVSLIQ